MAELVATIAGIGAAAGSAIKFSKTIYDFCVTIRGATQDIQAFASDVEAYGTVIRFAHLSLDRHFGSAGGPQSPVLEFMETNHVLVQLKQQTDGVRVHIEKLMWRIVSLKNKNEWWTRVKWVFQKPEFEAVGPKMESVKSGLNVVVSTITMEVMLQQVRTEPDVERRLSLRKRIKQLKRLVECQLKTIENFQEQELKRAPFERIHGESRPSVSPLYEMQAALVDLGDSMVQNETVPPIGSRSTSSSSTTSSRRHTRSHHSIHSARTSRRRISPTPIEIASAAPIPNPSPRARPSPLRHEIIEPPAQSPTPAHQSTRRIVSPASSPTTYAPAISPVSPLSSEAGPSQPRTIPIETTSRISTHLSPLSEGDYIGIYPSAPQIQININPHTTYPRISGSIATLSGPVLVDAVLVPDMEECVISRAFALELGLEITRLDDVESPALILFTDGRKESVDEQVRIEWTGTEVRSRPFRVRCLVSGALPWRLGFGRPFAEKRRHYSVVEGGLV